MHLMSLLLTHYNHVEIAAKQPSNRGLLCPIKDMDNKIVEIFIPGPAGRLEAKYFKSEKNTSPIALVLQPHPQYGGTMNNKVIVDTFHTFMNNGFSVCRMNFRGVGKSDGEFDNGQGELADAAAALDWIERENFDNSQCWICLLYTSPSPRDQRGSRMPGWG